jgi:O-antigen/teichoic acid export membrane protein
MPSDSGCAKEVMSQYMRKILRGSASNVVRVLVAAPFALILPPLLVHRMVPAEYSAWILILQGSAYINLLDLGLQTAIGKFVAEYDAADDRTGACRILSSSFAILCMSALLGAAVIAIVTWLVPEVFRQMPVALVGSMREGILLVGLSTAFALPFNAFLATFTGMQMYGFPTILAIFSKTLTSIALIILVLMHASLVQLALCMALFNVATAIVQFLGWRKYARRRVDFSFGLIDRQSAWRLTKYGGVLSVWSLAMLFISGLDMVIVGHYDYNNTGYYAVAATVTNFMLLIIGSMFAPLLPAVSSVQSGRTSSQIGDMVVQATRLCTLLLCLIGLPVALGAYSLLKLWVGQDYAMRSAHFLQVLVLGNVIRQLCYPYALVVLAMGKQHQATFAAISEATVNVVVSIYLVQKMGAIGVAIGTVVGAIVSTGVTLSISMKLTRAIMSFSRRHFLFEGLLRPATCLIPSIFLAPFWLKSTMMPMNPFWIAVWAVATLAIAWYGGLVSREKQRLKESALRLVSWKEVRG